MVHHALMRTSPKGKGQPFIGRCIQCNEEGLLMSAATLPCKNDNALSMDEALLHVIDPEKS